MTDSMNSDRLKHFQNCEVLRRVDAAEAKRLSPKANDCQRQLDAATSVWAIDGKKFIFVFTRSEEEPDRCKVTAWGIKAPGAYQRIKTVWVNGKDDIFEAVPAFLNEYFELGYDPTRYGIDVDMYYDIADDLADLSRQCPPSLKPKQKLLRVWSEIMPRFNEALADLDFRVLGATMPPPPPVEPEELKAFASRLEDTPADLKSETEEIAEAAGQQGDFDDHLLFSALPYDIAAYINESKYRPIKELEHRGKRIQGYCEVLDRKILDSGYFEPKTFPIANLMTYMVEFGRVHGYPDLEKTIGKMYRNMAENAIGRQQPLRLDYLELLVNTRRFNKRLPKNLSEYIKDLLDSRVHQKAGFWEHFAECSTLQGMLRKSWIQTMSLRLYGYDPDSSYTQQELCDLMPELITRKDPDSLLLYARILHDAEMGSVQIKRFDDHINEAEAIADSKTKLLKLEAARLFYHACARHLVPLEVGTHGPCVRAASDSKACSSAAKHPEWGEHYAHYVKMAEQGVSMRDFCLVKGLPYVEFKASYEAEIAEMNHAFQSDPYLRQILKLPYKDQQEFAQLAEEHVKCLDDLCKSMSVLTGEEIKVNDMISYSDEMQKRINQIVPKLQTQRGLDMPTATRFVLKYEELMRIESRMAAFRKAHRLFVESSE